MKTIVKFYLIATIGILLLTASCNKNEDEANCNCIKYTYELEYVNYRSTYVLKKTENTCEQATDKIFNNGSYTQVKCF